MLKEWTRSGVLASQVANKLSEWLDSGLQEWDISRDAPYFGFEIPGESGKYFYVWLDAPIGYMASFKKLCAKLGMIWSLMTTGARMPAVSSTTSLARTLLIFMPCSGQPCWKPQALKNRT